MPTIPVPKAPAYLQIARWIFDPIGYMETNFQQYGDIFQAYVSWGSTEPLVLVNDPQAIQHILTHDTGKTFTAPGDVNRILEPLLGRQGLILLSGNHHRRHRQLVMPPFHGERLKAYGEIIQQITQDVIAQWSTESPLKVRNAMQKITMRVILEAVFGLHEGERYRQLERLLSMRLDMTGSPLSSIILFLPWLQKDLGNWSPGGRLRQ
jgi:cytochrome P450